MFNTFDCAQNVALSLALGGKLSRETENGARYYITEETAENDTQKDFNTGLHNNDTHKTTEALLLLPLGLSYCSLLHPPPAPSSFAQTRAFGGATDEAERQEMASVNKLSIRGVRSFSPEDAEQVRYKLVLSTFLYESAPLSL